MSFGADIMASWSVAEYEQWLADQDPQAEKTAMSVVKPNATAETEGVAPKVAWPTAALVVVGAVLCILDLTGVIDVDDGVWIALLGAAGGVAGIGFGAPAALQKAKTVS